MAKVEAEIGQSPFHVNAVGDKLLMPDGTVRYLLFFEADEAWRDVPHGCSVRYFRTPNGFHVIGTDLGTARQKDFFFSKWIEAYPDSDYILGNWNWLMPHSEEELDFILKVAEPARPRVVRYYRDKRVFESLEEPEEHGATRA